MKVLIIGGIAAHVGKKATVKHIEACEGIGVLYQMNEFPEELGLALYYREDELVFLDGPVHLHKPQFIPSSQRE